MAFMDVITDVRFIRIAGTIALPILYYGQYAHQGVPAVAVSILILALYFSMFWIRVDWWNRTIYVFISSLIIAAALTLHYGYDVSDQSLLWPLIWIYATEYGKFGYLPILLASITIAAIVLISSFSLETLLALAGLFVGIRSRRIRQDTYRISKLHLKELKEAHRELQETHAELQEATVHSMRNAALEERTRLAHEIHDGLGHQLTSLIIQLQALEIMLPDNPAKAAESIPQLLRLARQAMAEVRVAVKEWANDEMGLGLVALKGLVSQIQGRSSVKFRFVQDSEVTDWPIETSIVLYRVLQEALTNVLRHSDATSVAVHIGEADDWIVLTISDNGSYTEDKSLTPGFGMKGMIQRCRMHGGDCTLVPEKPHGLRIEATLPIMPTAGTEEAMGWK